MKNKIQVKIFGNSRNIINHFIYNNINYICFYSCEEHSLFKIEYEDYLNVSKFHKCEIIKYYGIYKYKYFFKSNIYMIISSIFGLLLLINLSNTIFDVSVIGNDNKINELLIIELEKEDIKKYKSIKSFSEINDIKNRILESNSDYLEWIEIDRIGCNYKVYYTKRVKDNKREESFNKSDIVATKDGLIMHITSSSGETLKGVNDYVKKGEVLITGKIMKNDKLINQTRSVGEIYAEVWYLVNVSVPFKYTEYVKTDKVINHYYADIFNTKFTIMGKYDSDKTMNETKLILDKPYLFFKLYKETKTVYKYLEREISETGAYNEAISRAVKEIEKGLDEKEYIISKNVLKKSAFRSKMNVDIFFKVYENISEEKSIDDIGVDNEGNTISSS